MQPGKSIKIKVVKVNTAQQVKTSTDKVVTRAEVIVCDETSAMKAQFDNDNILLAETALPKGSLRYVILNIV